MSHFVIKFWSKFRVVFENCPSETIYVGSVICVIIRITAVDVVLMACCDEAYSVHEMYIGPSQTSVMEFLCENSYWLLSAVKGYHRCKTVHCHKVAVNV